MHLPPEHEMRGGGEVKWNKTDEIAGNIWFVLLCLKTEAVVLLE